MEIGDIYKKYLACKSVCTDTRKIEDGVMFFALKGGNFNGNEFASNALSQGASYAVIDEEKYKKDERYILVDDVLKCLQHLALHHRRTLDIPVIAITGSNGKTTTKELVNAVLSRKYKTYATKGNLNNHIGIPLTLLAIKPEIEIAIVEMGANHQKEIEGYCLIAEPSHGMITNIGKAHLEGFGGLEGVKKGKGELYDYLSKTNGVVFLNTNNEILTEMLQITSPVTYPNKSDYSQSIMLEASPFIVFKSENDAVTSQLIGAYNFENIAAALCIGKFFNVSSKEAEAAIALYDPQNNRSQVITKGKNKIILDAYNANPSSMKASLENFAQMHDAKKIIILGDMFELGEESNEEHKNLGRLISKLKFEEVVLCGTAMAEAKEELQNSKYFSDKKSLELWVENTIFEDYTILIKGSRGMGLESILQFL